MSSVAQLIRSDLRNFNPYSSARDEAKRGKIWLNANESPYALEMLDNILLNRYPERQPQHLVLKVADHFDVDNNQIILSRGSDEVIDLLTRLFCKAGEDAIMLCTPTFGMYSVCAQLQGASVIAVPLDKEKNYQLDLELVTAAWNSKVKIIFLCSPNNPTGNLLKEEDILFLCQKFSRKSMIVVDEAYLEFSDAKSMSRYINQYDNLVVLKTFSKAYGLAGARCGLLFSHEELVKWVLNIMAPYPLPAFTMKIILDALSVEQLIKMQQQIACIKSERKNLFNALQLMPWVKKLWPSDANFLLIETDNAQKIMSECAKQGIILRNMHNKPGLENCVRISIGLPEENAELVEVLKNCSL